VVINFYSFYNSCKFLIENFGAVQVSFRYNGSFSCSVCG
jgi:hypothetical protein